MAAKKKAAPKRKPAKRSTRASAGSSQLAQLRTMVSQLRKRIEQEAKARKLDSRLLVEARKARDEVMKQVGALRDQGKKLADQLRGALTDAKKREQAREEAVKLVSELRAELASRTEEVRRKTVELKNLAQESAERARQIITSEAPQTATSGEPVSKPGENEGGSQI